MNNEVIKALDSLIDSIDIDVQMYDDLQGHKEYGFYIALNMVYRNINRVKEMYTDD